MKWESERFNRLLRERNKTKSLPSETFGAIVHPTMETDPHLKEQHLVEQLIAARSQVKRELAKVIVGQEHVVEQILIALFSGGHCLITGAPGLAKTLLVKSIARIFHLDFHRIQFTPDLMPVDITGTEILTETDQGRKLNFIKGPIFANIVLADEINRTPPKTQAALLDLKQCKSIKLLRREFATRCPNHFLCSRLRTLLKWRGLIPCPKRNLIVSCSTW